MAAEILGVMGFTSPGDVVPDTERAGRLRAVSRQTYSNPEELVDFHKCCLHDCSSGDYTTDFFRMGFDCIDLNGSRPLQQVLSAVKEKGWLDRPDEKALRRSLSGRSFHLSNGKKLRLLYIASEGMILRTSGPNGLAIERGEAMPKNSRQPAAMMIHGDQDVYGYPVKRILKGAAPWVFRHNSPDGTNTKSPFSLVNLWIPLQQITMPLCLMDRSTLDKQHHQLRFELDTGEVLDRNRDRARNDIWTFLHDDHQQWYFCSEMYAGKAWVFDTLGMPHGAAILPGEKQAEQYFLRLQSCLEAMADGDEVEFGRLLAEPLQELPSRMTAALEAAIKNMEQLLVDGAKNPKEAMSAQGKWQDKARLSMDSVTRKSIELRAVAWVT